MKQVDGLDQLLRKMRRSARDALTKAEAAEAAALYTQELAKRAEAKAGLRQLLNQFDAMRFQWLVSNDNWMKLSEWNWNTVDQLRNLIDFQIKMEEKGHGSSP